MKKEFTELDVWIEARKLVSLIYEKTKTFPNEEIWSYKPNEKICGFNSFKYCRGVGKKIC